MAKPKRRRLYNDVAQSGMYIVTVGEFDNKTLVMDYMTKGYYIEGDPDVFLKPEIECPMCWEWPYDEFFFAPMRWMILSWRHNVVEDTDWKLYYTGYNSTPTPGRGYPYPW